MKAMKSLTVDFSIFGLGAIYLYIGCALVQHERRPRNKTSACVSYRVQFETRCRGPIFYFHLT